MPSCLLILRDEKQVPRSDIREIGQQTRTARNGCPTYGRRWPRLRSMNWTSGRFVELNSLLCGDFLQRVVDVRQMIGGDVAHDGAGEFVVAHAAVQPA